VPGGRERRNRSSGRLLSGGSAWSAPSTARPPSPSRAGMPWRSGEAGVPRGPRASTRAKAAGHDRAAGGDDQADPRSRAADVRAQLGDRRGQGSEAASSGRTVRSSSPCSRDVFRRQDPRGDVFPSRVTGARHANRIGRRLAAANGKPDLLEDRRPRLLSRRSSTTIRGGRPSVDHCPPSAGRARGSAASSHRGDPRPVAPGSRRRDRRRRDRHAAEEGRQVADLGERRCTAAGT
jgi:hypothetical protein